MGQGKGIDRGYENGYGNGNRNRNGRWKSRCWANAPSDRIGQIEREIAKGTEL